MQFWCIRWPRETILFLFSCAKIRFLGRFGVLLTANVHAHDLWLDLPAVTAEEAQQMAQIGLTVAADDVRTSP